MAKKSPTCRQLTGTRAGRAKLTQTYQLSERTGLEGIQAICRGKHGIFLMPIATRGERWREGGIPVIKPEWGMEITWSEDPCRLADAKQIGDVHTHPEGDPWFTSVDLLTEDPLRKLCLLYRKGSELRLKCLDLKAKSYTPPDDSTHPEKDDPNLHRFYTRPCDVSVSKGEIKKRRWPWRPF